MNLKVVFLLVLLASSAFAREGQSTPCPTPPPGGFENPDDPCFGGNPTPTYTPSTFTPTPNSTETPTALPTMTPPCDIEGCSSTPTPETTLTPEATPTRFITNTPETTPTPNSTSTPDSNPTIPVDPTITPNSTHTPVTTPTPEVPTPTPSGNTTTPPSTEILVPTGCTVEVPYYEIVALENLIKGYFNWRAKNRVVAVENLAIQAKGSKFQKQVKSARKSTDLLVKNARKEITSVPGIMVQCQNPPPICRLIHHPGVENYQSILMKLERLQQKRYERAKRNSESSALKRLFEISRATRLFKNVAIASRKAGINLANTISKTSYVCN